MRYRRRDRGEKKREIEERQRDIQREKIKGEKQRREIEETEGDKGEKTERLTKARYRSRNGEKETKGKRQRGEIL
jgi:hypothetical protein